jgi:DNA-binding LacI/PurR family transcriptional regulator
MAKRPTLREVAQLASVSTATVSLVINNCSGGNIAISAKTRQRVLAAVDQLGYLPNLAARSLRTSRTQFLAVMVHDLTNAFFPYFIRGAQLVAEGYGYHILVYDCIYDRTREEAFIGSVLQRRVDGVISVVYQAKPEDMEPLLQAHIPVVTIGPEWPNCDSVNVSDKNLTRDVVAYLVKQGHTRIAHLTGNDTIPACWLRMEGYQAGLAEARLPFDESLICRGNFSRSGVEEELAPLFAKETRQGHPTALVSCNDVMAIEAIQVLKRWGYRIPEDVAVTGFDNTPEGQYMCPSLTTIDNTPELMGQKAVELLLNRFSTEQSYEPQRVRLPGKLVLRQSTEILLRNNSIEKKEERSNNR